MLPSVNSKDGAELANDGVLVGVGLDANVASLHVLHQPRPAGALDASQSGVELALELIERAVGVVDLLCESAGGRLTAALGFGCEVLPEEGVVYVSAWRNGVSLDSSVPSSSFFLLCRPTTVEVNERLLCDLSLDVAVVLGLLQLLDGGVVGGDVGLVVLGVVQLHDLAADGGLERAIVV